MALVVIETFSVVTKMLPWFPAGVIVGVVGGVVIVIVFDVVLVPKKLSFAEAVMVYIPAVGVHEVFAVVVPEARMLVPFFMVMDCIESYGSESVAEAESVNIVPVR